MEISNYKNIIFDLGGVILNIDYHLTIDAFKNFGIKNFDELYTQAKQNGAFDSLETGKLSNQEFYTYINSVSEKELTKEEIDTAWNAMLLDIPQGRKEFLEKVSKKFNIYLLSNTNQIHIDWFRDMLINKYGKNWFLEVFKKDYYSHEIGLRKPNTNVFEFVLNENQLTSDETIFFDDSIQHIEGAMKAGITAIHITSDKSIEHYLENVLS